MNEVSIVRNGRVIVLEQGALDAMTRLETAFPSFAAMLDAKGGFRPTLADPVLADAYDVAQDARGDRRMAFRRPRNVWKAA